MLVPISIYKFLGSRSDMRLIYVFAALIVLLAFLEITNDAFEKKREIEALGTFKVYLEQARTAARVGNQPPEPEKVSLPTGYNIMINGDFVELHYSGVIVTKERWN